MAYKHGVLGERKSASGVSNISQATVPVYIGSLPVQRITGGFSDYVNKPILITSYRDVNALGLYSDDWNTFTLCEAIHAHFVNTDTPTGPIVLVNMLNPDEMQASEAVTATVNLIKEGTSYVGYIEDAKCIVDELAITADGTTFSDGEITYSNQGDKVKIEITKTGFNATSVTATYKTVEFKVEDVTAEAFQTAIDAMDVCEQITGYIPNILGAPQLSEVPELHDLMVQKAIDKCAGKWNFICVSDIPSSLKTFDEVKAWKNTNNYTHMLDKVFYPKATKNGKVYHLSTLAAYTMQSIDAENEDVPYESPSNKVINADNIVNDEGVVYMFEHQANEYNAIGITTAIAARGEIRIWGPSMANFNFDNLKNIPAEERFDICVRMSCYLFNYLQYNHLDAIDTSIGPKDVDEIQNSVQLWLDSLVNDSMLLYATIEFDNDTDLASGDIVFSLNVTYPVVAKSITFKLLYTDRGLVTLVDGGVE